MKKILTFIILTFSLTAFANPVYNFPILGVVDGDTVKIQAPFLPPPLKPELSVRVYGVDTPEKGHRAQCPSENSRGLAATEFTKKMIAQAKVKQVVLRSWDKYGGRVLGDIILDGKSLRELLIANGFAREYYGEAKTSWCQ